LAEGDVVKIDLGVHIDGFIAAVAHSVVVGSNATLTPEQTQVRNNVISAAYTAAEVAVRLLKPGNTNHMVTQAIKEVADAFDVRPISGTLMHQMKQYVIDGNKMILLREEPEQQKVEVCTFEAGEVYAIDIAMSSGEGKPRETGNRTTVFKRAVEKKYALKSKTSRQFFNDVNKRFPTLPFSIRSFEDEKTARMGIRECVNHDLLLPYPVLNEKRSDFVGHVKVTVLLLPSGNTAQITGLAPLTYLQAATAEPDLDKKLSASLPVGLTLSRVLQETKSVSLPENLVNLLNQSPQESKKKAKKNAKKASSEKMAEEK
jgi:curved DNA binding protein